jgi:hypothetical protein
MSVLLKAYRHVGGLGAKLRLASRPPACPLDLALLHQIASSSEGRAKHVSPRPDRALLRCDFVLPCEVAGCSRAPSPLANAPGPLSRPLAEPTLRITQYTFS